MDIILRSNTIAVHHINVHKIYYVYVANSVTSIKYTTKVFFSIDHCVTEYAVWTYKYEW